MAVNFTAKDLMKVFKIDSDVSLAIMRLVQDKADPKNYPIKTLYYDSIQDEVLKAIDLILDGHGVEGVLYPNSQMYGLSYVNRGDAYDTTICYDSMAEEWLLTSWGEWYESVGGLDVDSDYEDSDED